MAIDSRAGLDPTTVVHYLVGRRDPDQGTSYVVSPAERQRMIAEAAYFKAQERGFGEGGQLNDWLAAEREVQQRLDAAQARKTRLGEAVVLPARKAAAAGRSPTLYGMAERRTQSERPRDPERRRACALARPARKFQ